MVLCSSWNVTKATEYYSLFERVARDRLIAPVLRFATNTTCPTLEFPPRFPPSINNAHIVSGVGGVPL